ncbi:MAG TPA: o-succinylbenzoate synthase [Cyclobacteriaceae bacterium]
MALRLEYFPHTLKFTFSAGTSRGVMHERQTWILKIELNGVVGYGEVPPIPRLSIDDIDAIENQLEKISKSISTTISPKSESEIFDFVENVCPGNFPSIRFGLETALLDITNGGKKMIFDTPYYKGNKSMPVNGLIWMGSKSEMTDRINQKLDEGYSCIKIKIGALDFQSELDLLDYIRSRPEGSDVTLRLDANGAFQNHEALSKIADLAKFDIHSIEQPILPNQPEALEMTCKYAQIPVALDEELIAIQSTDKKIELLDTVKPAYIVLKPALLGGFKACTEWIQLASDRNIGWWITSALESNIGLNAISQFTSRFDNPLHQGLGTGQLYHNNFPSPLLVEQGHIRYQNNRRWDINLS